MAATRWQARCLTIPSGTEEDESAEDEDEREERHTKIHLNEIDVPEWQKIVYDRQGGSP